MYKIIYKKNDIDEDIIENIDSLIIDVRDINYMKYVDVLYNGDINLLILYVRCLKHFNRKLKLNDKFIIKNNFKDNQNIIRSILNCNWLINEDDVINNLDKLEDTSLEFQREINILSASNALKDYHRIFLMQYFINSLKKAKKKFGLEEKKYIKK